MTYILPVHHFWHRNSESYYDGAIIQRALDETRPGGAKYRRGLEIPGGVFHFDQMLGWYDNSRLTGSGNQNTILKFSGTSGMGVADDTQNTTNALFRDFGVVGTPGQGLGINTLRASRTHFENVWSSGFDEAWRIDGSAHPNRVAGAVYNVLLNCVGNMLDGGSHALRTMGDASATGRGRTEVTSVMGGLFNGPMIIGDSDDNLKSCVLVELGQGNGFFNVGVSGCDIGWDIQDKGTYVGGGYVQLVASANVRFGEKATDCHVVIPGTTGQTQQMVIDVPDPAKPAGFDKRNIWHIGTKTNVVTT